MQYYGGSTVEINLSNIKKNTEKIIARCPGYDYRFGVVKAEAYGHSLEAVQAVLDGGCNYLAVSSLDEAVRIRNDYDSVPILAFFPIDVKYADVYEKYSITASVDSAESLCVLKERNIKVHIKADTGMNRFGFKDKKNFAEAVHTAASYGILEGAYTHLYKACNRDITQKQTSLFKSFIDEAGSVKIPVIHVYNSEALLYYDKLDYANGMRVGDLLYALTSDKTLGFQSAFSLKTNVMKIKKLMRGETIGYDGIFKADEDNTYIAILPIGYANGIIRHNTGRAVYIGNKAYTIVGNVCMSVMFIKVDETVHEGDEVYVLRDSYHVMQTAEYLKTVPTDVICGIDANIKRVFTGAR